MVLDQLLQARAAPASPFGGVGASGYGREMGFEAMREYTQPKSVWVNVDAQIPPYYPALNRHGTVHLSRPAVARGLRRGQSRAARRARSTCSAPRGARAVHAQQREQAEALAASARLACGGRLRRSAVMHVPVETARAARDFAARLGADCAVAIGGGSTTGLGKAIALELGLPIIAIPTTYAGSEMTPIYGLTEGGAEEDRPRSARAAEDRDLRPGTDAVAAASDCR